ncbi:COG1361 S-layer family protein [Nanoarchaeota archaeon]
MKKTIYLIMFVLFVSLIGVHAEMTYISDSDILTASLVNQNPDPAIAGNVVELRIGVENWGSSAAEGYDLELLLEYPFQVVPGERYVKSTGTLQGFQTEDDQKILKFKVRSDREATEGSYDLDILLYKTGEKAESAIKKTLSVDLKNRESAEVIYIDKVKLIPGQQTPIQFTINNVGAAPLRDLSFSWENEDDIVLPVGSSDTRYVKYLGIGEKTTIIYDAIADTNADPGLYKLELSLTYEDPVTGDLTTITNNAGIYVGGETDFAVSFSENAKGQVSFSVANIGSNPASSVSVRIPAQKGWKITGPDSSIIGNLDKGDYTIASFTLSPAGDSSAQHGAVDRTQMSKEDQAAMRERLQKTRGNQTADTLKVAIDYTDTMGNRDTLTKEVNLDPSMLGTSAMDAFRGMQRSSPLDGLKKYLYILAVFVLVIAAFHWYKKYRVREGMKKR